MSRISPHTRVRLVEDLLPSWIAEEPDPLTRNRARMLVLVVLGAAAFAVATALFHWLSGSPARGIFNLACAPLALLLFWMFRNPGVRGAGPSKDASPDRARMVRRALYTFLSILIVAVSIGPFLSSNGYHVPVVIAVLPFLAATLGGPKIGGAWTGVTLAVLGAMAVGVSDDPVRGLVAWNTFLVAGVVGAGGCLVEVAREQADRQAQAANLAAKTLARSRDEKAAELRASRELLAHAFRRMPAMLILSELATGRILDVNKCFERLSGWTLEEARGRTLSELNAWVAPEDRQRLIDSILERGKTHDVEVVLRTKSGSQIWLLAAADILEIDGRSHVLAQGVDITDRKRAEQGLAASRKLLEERVIEGRERLRASELELRGQRQLASIGILAAGVAHQINNPIASIMASAEYALLAAPDSADRGTAIRDHALRSVVAEALRCGQIVKNVLRFARQQPTARWIEDVVPLVRRTATLCRNHVVDHGGELKIETDDVTLEALISPIEIEQVLVNLIRNAAEALEGGGLVSVGAYGRDGFVEISIVDDGRGIPRDELDQLFEPFYTTRVHHGGTGLGLCFAHGVVLDHGGTIQVDSELGKGTRIRVRIPLAAPPRIAAQLRQESARP